MATTLIVNHVSLTGQARITPDLYAVGMTFRDACCNKLGITHETFEKKVLLTCLPPFYSWLGYIEWHINRSYFEPDQHVIRSVADCKSAWEVREEINYHFLDKNIKSGFSRKVLRYRLSGRRLIHLANQCFPEQSR